MEGSEHISGSREDAAILHVDMDAFFAAVELIDRPDLVGRPVIIGGSMRSVVVSATYEARAFGVRSAMPMARARALCPQAEVIAPRRHRYVAVSAQVMDILAGITPRMEQVSIDEAFLDVRGARRLWGSPVEIAQLIRSRVRDHVGIVASVGIGVNKSVAKMASTQAKPDGLLHIPSDRTLEFLHAQAVGALWGVGPKTQERLHRHGIDTVAQLANRPVTDLHRILGVASGQHIHELSWGIDHREVCPGGPAKSVGTETTFDADVRDIAALEAVLLDQAHKCASRLRHARATTSTLSIKIRFSDFHTLTRSRSVAATDSARDLYSVARELLASVSIPPGGVRLIGLRAEGLHGPDGGGAQLSFDGSAARDAEGAMDRIHGRFGAAALRPATLVRPRPAGSDGSGRTDQSAV